MKAVKRRSEADRIGLMADSHGSEALLHRALTLFGARQCTRWIHLGDICDSTRPETACGCLRFLSAPQAAAVRGNNDHSLLQTGAARLSDGVRKALARLPLVHFEPDAVLAHSLPFTASLGMRCMLEDLDDEAARRFFQIFPDRHLFRGHGHQASRIWRVGDAIRREALVAGRRLSMAGLPPQILTCGALTQGLALIWDRGQQWLECVAIDQA